MLSLRPLLLLTTKFPSKFASLASTKHSETLDVDLVRRSCNVCVTTALRLIDNIQRNIGTSYTCSAWHSVYCKRPLSFPAISDPAHTYGLVTFASALILLAAPMCPAIDTESTKPSFDMSWDQCLSILEHYKDQIQAARRAIIALQELKSRMNHTQSQGTRDLPLSDP